MKSLGLSQEDAQFRNKWGRKDGRQRDNWLNGFYDGVCACVFV